jgi:hypothetical protein
MQFFTSGEVALMTGVNKNTLRKWLHDGWLPLIKNATCPRGAWVRMSIPQVAMIWVFARISNGKAMELAKRAVIENQANIDRYFNEEGFRPEKYRFVRVQEDPVVVIVDLKQFDKVLERSTNEPE